MFRSAVLQYLRKAHTHEDVDGTYGQLTTELGYTEFHNLDELLEVLLRKMKNLGIDEPSRNNSAAYEIAECADWASWVENVPTSFKNHGGPEAPHSFKFVRRDDMNKELDRLSEDMRPSIDDFPASMVKHDNDVFLMTRGHMSDHKFLQTTAVASFTLHQKGGDLQPRGTHFLKNIPADLARSVTKQCQTAMSQNLITQRAADFLTSWVAGTLPRARRQARYAFLDWRWDSQSLPACPARRPIAYDGVTGRMRPIAVVLRVGDGRGDPLADLEAERPDTGSVALVAE